MVGLSCLGCGETTDEGELCDACRASARRQTRLLVLILLCLGAIAVVALIVTA